MNTGALVYFANYIPSNFNQKLSCFFNFEKTGKYIYSEIGKDKNIISGCILPNTGNFWMHKPKVGFFSGNYIKLENIENSSFNFKDFTFITSFEKLNFEGGVLMSSLEKNTGIFLDNNNNYINKEYYKGFEFGITANNYLYFEYFKNDGPACIISNEKINDKSCIYFSISKNIINFGNIDFNKKQLINTNSVILDEYLFDPKSLYVGYNPNATGLYSNNKNIVGLIDNMLITYPHLLSYEILNVSSGFIYDFDASTSFTYSSITTGITGSYTALTGYRTEITGWERIATGIFTNPWGISVMGYMNQPLIRQVPLSGIFNLSGEIVTNITEYSGIKFDINNEKFLSYQKNVINFLNKVDNEDYIETRFTTGYSKMTFNKKNINIEYDPISNSYSNPRYLTNFYNVFANGQLQRSGDFKLTNDPYNKKIRIIENDYAIGENNRIVLNNFYDLTKKSSVIIDSNYSIPNYLGEFENLNILDNNNKDLFLNGQKLSEKIHFDIDNNFLLKNKFNTNLDQFNSKSTFAHNKNADIFITSKYNSIDGTGIVPIYVKENENWILKYQISGFYYPIEKINTNSDASIIAISVYWEPAPITRLGIVYIYTGNKDTGWSLKQSMTGECRGFTLFPGIPTDPCDESLFGDTVKISENGNTILITNPVTYTGSQVGLSLRITGLGVVNLYTGDKNSGWNLKQSILPPLFPSSYYNRFGYNADINNDGSLIVINQDSFFDKDKYISIYTGNNNGWSLKQIISHTGILNLAGFTTVRSLSVSDNGDVIVMGFPEHGDNFLFSGTTLIYTGDKNNGWNFKQKIIGDGLNFNFGISTSINNDNSIIAIGANYDKWLTPLGFFDYNRGSVFIFTGNRNDGWNFYQKLSGENIDSDFGYFVSIDNNKNSIFVNNVESYASLFTNNNIILNKNLSLTGSLMSVSKDFDYNIITSGTTILNLDNNFYFDNTEIYVNGIRQTLNYDYFEFSKFDITTGIKILLENNKDYIYNNEGFIK